MNFCHIPPNKISLSCILEWLHLAKSIYYNIIRACWRTYGHDKYN